MKFTVTYTLSDAVLGIEGGNDVDQDDSDAVEAAVKEQLGDMVLADPEDFLDDIKFDSIEAVVTDIEFNEDELTFED
jgi:hypothetical protein